MTDPSPNLPAPVESPGSTALAKPEFSRAIAAALQRIDVRKDFITQAKAKLVAGQDYGEIPGCDKPALFKSGAEALAQSLTAEAEPLFSGCGRFSKPVIEFAVEDHGSPAHPMGLFYYRVSVDLLGPSGQALAHGVGSCSTQEKKYREARNYEGRDKEPILRRAADSANTVLKMAEKRAKVDAAISLTGASAMFTQDVEDAPDADGDPLDRPLTFGKHQGKSPRQIVQADRGWAEWFVANGKKPGDKVIFRQALDEADEMATAQADAKAAPPKEPTKAPAARPPATKDVTPTPKPAAPTPPAQVTHAAASPEQIAGVRQALVDAATRLGFAAKSPERRAFYEEAGKLFDVRLGRRVVMLAEDPCGPSTAEMPLLLQAVRDLEAKVVTPSAIDQEWAAHGALVAQLGEAGALEYGKLLHAVLPEGDTLPPNKWPLDKVREVTRRLADLAKPRA